MALEQVIRRSYRANGRLIIVSLTLIFVGSLEEAPTEKDLSVSTPVAQQDAIMIANFYLLDRIVDATQVSSMVKEHDQKRKKVERDNSQHGDRQFCKVVNIFWYKPEKVKNDTDQVAEGENDQDDTQCLDLFLKEVVTLDVT